MMMMTNEEDDDLVLAPPEGVDEEGDQGDLPPEAAEPEADDEGDDFAVEFEGDDNGADETPLVTKLRQEIRERDKRLAEYSKPAKAPIVVGEKPTLESCEYDEDKFEIELDAWKERKAKAEAQAADDAREADARADRDQRAFVNYRARAATLPVKDFEQAETAVIQGLPELHQRALLHYTKDPAKLVYALHQNPAKLSQIAEEPDVIKAILMMTDLEGKMKVTTRKKPPTPESETIQRGSARPSAGSDKELERLEKDADRTGDRSKLIAYKSKQKKAA